MQYTEKFQLGLWEPSDQVLHQSFNENTEKIEAALAQVADNMPRLATGTYTGTNKYTDKNPTVLTLPFPPKFLFIWGKSFAYYAHGIQGQPMVAHYDNGCVAMTTTWNGNTVSFYHNTSTSYQQNRSDDTYSYVALG